MGSETSLKPKIRKKKPTYKYTKSLDISVHRHQLYKLVLCGQHKSLRHMQKLEIGIR